MRAAQTKTRFGLTDRELAARDVDLVVVHLRACENRVGAEFSLPLSSRRGVQAALFLVLSALTTAIA